MEGKMMVRIQGKKMTLCKHYLHGSCKNGSNCNYLHDPCRKNKTLCKAFVRGYCSRVGSEDDDNDDNDNNDDDNDDDNMFS